MQIVTDSAADLSTAKLEELNIHTVPLSVQLDGKTYLSGVDLQPEEFYRLLSQTESFPTTSQPSPGDFATLYRELAQTDPEILSIHISSGLSGTLNAARSGAGMVPEAHVTFFELADSLQPIGLDGPGCRACITKQVDCGAHTRPASPDADQDPGALHPG